MSTRKTLRLIALLVWFVLAILTVGTTWAQDGGTSTAETTVGEVQAPDQLDSVAARLAPLLVGAALIERTIEFLFNWFERAVLDASHYLNKTATAMTGLVHIGLRDAWNQMNELTAAVLNRRGATHDVDGDGADETVGIDDWPLAMLEQRLEEVQAQVVLAEKRLQEAMKSEVYVARKKVAAGWLSIGLGVFLALTASLRLFKPLGVHAWGGHDSAFDAIDLVLAGIIMGLGTDWVHQIITFITKGQRALGRVGAGPTYDPAEVEQLATAAVEAEFEARLRELRERAETELEERFRIISGRDESPP